LEVGIKIPPRGHVVRAEGDDGHEAPSPGPGYPPPPHFSALIPQLLVIVSLWAKKAVGTNVCLPYLGIKMQRHRPEWGTEGTV